MFFAFSSAKYLHFPALSASGGCVLVGNYVGCAAWVKLLAHLLSTVALWLSLLHIYIGFSISPPVTHELILQWEILVFCSCSS